MKTTASCQTIFCIAAIAIAAVNAPATTFDYASLKKSLSAVTVTELPAKAAQLVSEASAQEQELTAMAVVRLAVERKNTMAAPVVGAVVRAAPSFAGSVAATAASQQPSQVSAITKAAVSAAPAQVGSIVRAVCSELPAKYRSIAIAASEAAPDAKKEILEAVSSAVPVLKTFIERAMADGSTLADVMSCIEGFVEVAAKESKVSPEKFIVQNTPAASGNSGNYHLHGPTPGPPFTTLPPSPTEINRTNTVVVPPGGSRDYSAP